MESCSNNLVSVVIPTLNEELTIGNLLADLSGSKEVMEIIVVDGGSEDRTRQVISTYPGVKLIRSAPGRAVQLNAGAKETKGGYLWFLHADTRVDFNVLCHLLAEIRKSDSSGSCFLKFDKQGFWYKLYSGFSKINWSIFTYGDQGIFVKRNHFMQLGGYRHIPIMEDIDFVRRAKKKFTFKKLNIPIVTSARRFEQNGVVWQELKNIFLVILYLLGTSPFFLKRFY